MQDYVAAIFRAAGSEPEEAEIIAAHLVEANLAGHDSHGVMRVYKYVDWVKAGQVVPNRHATVVTDRGAMVLVDGDFGYGQVIGKEAMAIAAERAKAHGFAAMSIRNAGHLGRIGAWAEQLAEAGLASFHFVNTSGFGILVAPHGGSDRRLSANPLAAGVPSAGGRPLILDIATSVVAEGKIQVMKNKGEQLAPGLVIDGAGKPTTDPAAFYADPPGAIFPFGGHKGSGLSFFCEVLAGLAQRRLRQQPEVADGGTAGQQHADARLRPGGLRRRRFLRRRHRPPRRLDQGLAADRAGRRGAPARRDRGPDTGGAHAATASRSTAGPSAGSSRPASRSA